MPNPAPHPAPPSRWAQLPVWLGVAACIAGLVAFRMWSEVAASRVAENLALMGLAALLAWPLRRWRGMRWASALAVVWLLLQAWMGGVLPVIAVAALALAAIALGRVVVREGPVLYALLAGLALSAGALGWLLPLPVHQPWTYAALILLALVLGRRGLARDLRTMEAGWREQVAAAPLAAALAVSLAGLASTGSWLPTLQHDDLAFHLGLPWQLQLEGRYALDPTHQVWALAAWAGDVLQAVPQVLVHAESRGALNLLWLLAGGAALWRLSALLGMVPVLRWATLAAWASLPLVGALMGGMQTETAASAVTVALAALVLEPSGTGRPGRRLVAGALLFGLLAGLKPLHAIAVLPLLAWAAWRHRRSSGWRALPLGAAAALLAGSSSYAYAWIIAGNPLLPLFNSRFGSPFYPATDFQDPRWHAGFDLRLPWDMSFHTSAYLEAWDGGIGFVLVALAGAWLVALALPRTRALAICGALAMALPLAGMQYARYAHPGMVLLLPALVLALQYALAPRAVVALVAALCALHLAFLPNAHWLPHVGGAKRALASLGRDAPLFERYAPERGLVQAMRERGEPRAPVLLLDPDQPWYAELGTLGRSTSSYDLPWVRRHAEAEADPSGAAWAAAWREECVGHLLLRPETLSPAQRAGLDRSGATLEASFDDAQWWRLPVGTAP